MSGTPAVCEVAVALPVRRTFHYRVPEALACGVGPGAVVVVPFGRRHQLGLVVARVERAPDGVGELKPVQRVIEPEGTLPAGLVGLLAETAAYYFAGPGELLRCAVPALRLGRRRAGAGGDGSEAAPVRAVGPREEGRLSLVEGAAGSPLLRRSPRARALVAWLAARGGEGGEREARRESGASAGVVARLVATGAVERRAVEVARDLAALAPATRRLAGLELTAEQSAVARRVAAAVRERRFAPFLLHGVTGSGKTLVYLAGIEAALAEGRGALFLVPEIALTPAFAGELRGRFGDLVSVFHSGLSDGERHDAWRRVRRGAARVVFGARSAVFAPLPDLGLVVVDEEHDPAYKQGERPHYNARDVAVLRAKLAGVPVVLGSATPSLESWHNARAGRYALLELRTRVSGRRLPAVEIVDLREDFAREGSNVILSARLREALGGTLAAGEQAILLLNRRGWASFLLCRECGRRAECPNCSVCLVFHRREAALKCHHCGFRRGAVATCDRCGGSFLQLIGHGTEQVEQAVREALPSARVLRLDRDAVRRRGDVERTLAAFESGKADVLVGTQMVAKGHDYPNVTLVGVVSVDAMLALPDFRTTERAFALLTQVAGRAGRGDRPGRVVFQTYHPDNPAVLLAAEQDYAGFAERELKLRRLLRYPPASALANLIVRGRDRGRVQERAREAAATLRAAAVPGVLVRGPGMAPVERIEGAWRAQVLVRASGRRALRSALEAAWGRLGPLVERGVVDLDVDPYDLL